MSVPKLMVLEMREVSCCRGEESFANATLSVQASSIHILRGEHGASLLLRVATLLEAPDRGVLELDGERISGAEEAERAAIRSRAFGYVFDAPFLLPELSVAENIAMPLFKLLDLDAVEARDRTESMLRFAFLEPLATRPAGELTLFDQQRVALARAVAHRPLVLALDHADASLSNEEAAEFLNLARRVRRELGISILARCFHRADPLGDEHVLTVADGCVREETFVVRERMS